MLDKILYVVDKCDLPIFLLPFLQIGTMIAFHSSGNLKVKIHCQINCTFFDNMIAMTSNYVVVHGSTAA